MTLEFTVLEKQLSVTGSPQIICGNSDYTAHFTFYGEWLDYSTKTVHLAYWKDGRLCRESVETVNDTCTLPPLYGITEVIVDVSAGNIRTAAPVQIPCRPCILDRYAKEDTPKKDLLNELMEMLSRPIRPTVYVTVVRDKNKKILRDRDGNIIRIRTRG